MKTAEQIMEEARKLREEANQLIAARQATLEGMLNRGEAWRCRCGQINGNHNAQCCRCGEEPLKRVTHYE